MRWPSPRDIAPASRPWLALSVGVISTALGYTHWNAALRRICASQGGAVQLSAPVLTGGMGILLLGEHLTWSLVLEATAVLVGIYLNRVGPRQPHAAGAIFWLNRKTLPLSYFALTFRRRG